MSSPHVIKSAMTVDQSQKKVSDGILQSAMLTSFQRDAMDGIIKSAIPEKGPAVKPLHKSKASKTPQHFGSMHFPGARYA
jgi:hypothetical protein